MAEQAFNNWIKVELCKLLNDTTTVEDLMLYICSIDNKEELLTIIKELFGSGSGENLDGPQREFIREIIVKWDRLKVPENVMVYRKNATSEPSNNSSKNSRSVKQVGNRQAFDMSEIAQNIPGNQMTESEKKAKKKTNYVSLYSKEGNLNTVVIPGRHSCECQAQKHSLVGNCLGCGRVVCKQEGSGPCMFCGVLVCSRDEREILARNSHKSEKLHKKLMSVDGGRSLSKPILSTESVKALEKAKAYKERLLDYDRTCTKRTKVIDDESDYYSINSNWMSKAEKLALKEKRDKLWEIRHGSRLNKKSYTLDFAGRRVIEAEFEELDPTDDMEVMSANFGNQNNGLCDTDKSNSYPELLNPNISEYIPMFISDTIETAGRENKNNIWKTSGNCLQDEQLKEMSDPGMCLSMHQPWASLLVAGIKRDEGRTWYSGHRGRLWIAATSQTPAEEDVRIIENQSSDYWGSVDQKMPNDFPREYPTSCVLGCVDVKEILTQEEYRENYPDGESKSPYVFVCRKPYELTLKFPVKGKHKIWKLEPSTHKAAKRGLLL